MVPDVISRTLNSRVWLWPLLVAAALVALDLSGHKISPEVLLTVTALVIGSTGTEGARDIVTKGAELAKEISALLGTVMPEVEATPAASMDPLPGAPKPSYGPPQ